MVQKTEANYVFPDDATKFSGHREPENRRVIGAEAIATALIAGMYSGGSFGRALSLVRGAKLTPGMPGESWFNRRTHGAGVFLLLDDTVKRLNISAGYAMDSHPVRMRDNIRIGRSRRVRGRE